MGLSGNRSLTITAAEGSADAAFARAMAGKLTPTLTTAMQQSVTIAGELNKWILASLVTLNGGAILALSNLADTLPGPAMAGALFWFATGCILAVIAALVGALSTIATSGPLGEVLAFWLYVESTGEFDHDRSVKLGGRLARRGLITYGVAALVGIGSLVAFGFGVTSVSERIAATGSTQLSSEMLPERSVKVTSSAATQRAP